MSKVYAVIWTDNTDRAGRVYPWLVYSHRGEYRWANLRDSDDPRKYIIRGDNARVSSNKYRLMEIGTLTRKGKDFLMWKFDLRHWLNSDDAFIVQSADRKFFAF